MLQYIELKPEAPYEIPENHPEDVWPAEGHIEFRLLLPKRPADASADSLLWQELLAKISSRLGFGAQGYFANIGTIFWYSSMGIVLTSSC
jgi:hypothetical protein